MIASVCLKVWRAKPGNVVLLAGTVTGLTLLNVGAMAAQPRLPAPKPVPRMQALPLPHHEVSFQRDGETLCLFHFAPDLHRPFVYPVIGPSGRSLTRMGHPHDPESHSHHNSVWISHHDVNGMSFWSDRGPGRIVHQRIEQFEDGNDEAAVWTLNHWVASNRVWLIERRRTAVHTRPDGTWWLLLDLELRAAREPVVLGKTPFGMIGVRVAKTIGVHDGGGMIRNSEGGTNEKGVFWKPARWVDYSGPITAQAVEGLTLMDHPRNPNHPTVFHVRDDGWMGASLSFNGPVTVSAQAPLRLRYGIYVHSGLPDRESLDKIWREFAQLPLPAWSRSRKK